MRSTLLLSGLLLLVPTSLVAQTASAAAGDRPHILLDSVGPDGWRMRLGPTNLGSLLESEKGRQLWQPQIQPLLAMWQQLAGDEAAFAASRARLLDYGGRIRLGLWFDPSDDPGNDPAACIAVVLDGDGRSDLGAIAEDLRTTLYQSMAGEWTESEIEGTKWTVRRDADASVTAPTLNGNQLLIAATNEGDLALAIRRTRALATSGPATLKPNSPALRVDFDLETIVAAQMANESEVDGAMMKTFGLDTLGTGSLTISTAGPRVQVEFAQAFLADERGLFSALLPATAAVPTLLHAAPANGSWTVGHLDCQKLYTTILAALSTMRVADDEDPRASIKEELGIDPETELLAHMTDELLFWMTEPDDFDDDPIGTEWALMWRLRDEDAFRKGLLAMLPKGRPFLQLERTEKYEDVELFRYGNMLSYDIWLAVGRQVFVIAGGRNAEDRIGQALERCKTLPTELPPDQAIPAGFAGLQRFLPPGCHGYSAGSARNIMSLPTDFWLEALTAMVSLPELGTPMDPDEDAERREALQALLEQHQLDVARAASGYAERTFRWRLYW